MLINYSIGELEIYMKDCLTFILYAMEKFVTPLKLHPVICQVSLYFPVNNHYIHNVVVDQLYYNNQYIIFNLLIYLICFKYVLK